MYNEALAAVKDGKDLPENQVFVCDICGNTVYGEVPERCPVCGARHNRFFEVK